MAKVMLIIEDDGQGSNPEAGFVKVRLESDPPFPASYQEGKPLDVSALTVAQWVGHEMMKMYIAFEKKNVVKQKRKVGTVQ